MPRAAIVDTGPLVALLDRDFTVYRKRGREPIPLIIPPAA